MKTKLLLGIITGLVLSLPALGVVSKTQLQDKSNIKTFIGTYDLVSSQDSSGSFCYRGVIISQESGEIHLYRADMKDNGSMISGKLNGPARASTVSHGEAMSSTKYFDKVSLENRTLTFQSKGTVKFMGIPAGSESDIYIFSIADEQGSLNATRKFRKNLTSGTAKCEYQKIN